MLRVLSMLPMLFSGLLSFAEGTDRVLPKPASGEEFCKNLNSSAPLPGQSLKTLRLALGLTSLGMNAKDATGPLSQAGFLNITDEAISDPSKMPLGSILVLDSSGAKNCAGVSQAVGHVVVKCGPDELFWMKNQKRVLSQFLKQQRGCIKSVMSNPAWNAPSPERQKAKTGGGRG